MTPLGQSPVVAGSQMQQTGNAGQPGFLPGYLMGSFPQQQSNRVMSPTGLSRSLSTANSANTPSGSSNSAKPVNGFLTPTMPASQVRTPSEKAGGPPIKGLYSNTPSKEFGTPLAGGPGTPRHLNTPQPTTPQLSFGGTPTAFKEHDVTDSAFHDGNTWVTIFGFPPSAASYILSQFSQCGTVLHHFIPPNGNWMTIRFQTKMQAQKALGRNGRIFGGSLMVGVVPCTDPPAEAATNASTILDHTNNAENSVLSLNSSLAAHHNRSIRPLTQSFKAAHNENDISAIANTPNKNSGIVGKAMEYIFGW